MTRMIVDTNVVRSLGAGELEPDAFALLREAGVSIHLGDSTATELISALTSRRLLWSHWVRARDGLQRILSRSQPILLGGQEGLQTAGFPVRYHRSPRELAEIEKFLRASWRILQRADSYDALLQIRAQAGHGTVSFDSHLIRGVVSEFQSSWASEIDDFFVKVLKLEPGIQRKLPARGDSIEAIEACLAAARDALDGKLYAHAPPPSFRLDAFLRVRALVLLRRLRTIEPYNPAKRQNDSFDHELLKYLAFPAALCSNDRSLVASVRATKSWQMRWIVRPHQLRQRQLVESIASLDWPRDKLDQ